MSPRILTVGAYERDNFGDLLFLLVTVLGFTLAFLLSQA